MQFEIDGKNCTCQLFCSTDPVLEMQTDVANENLIRQIAVNNLENGIYIVQVILNNYEMYYTKMVVKK